MQSICEEATYLTIAHDYESGADLIAKIDAIVEKYRPTFIPAKAPGYTTDLQPVIRWCFETYPNIEDMLRSVPYGGSTVTYPAYELNGNAAIHATQCYLAGKSYFIPVFNKEIPANPEHNRDTISFMKNAGLPNNRVFVLTVTCNYPFSSSLVRWLFNGGANTKKVTHGTGYNGEATGAEGTIYLLWARGAGLVNAK